MAKKRTKITLPSVLAFEKKIVPSDGYFYASKWEEREEYERPLEIKEKSVRGVIGNYDEKLYSGAKSDEKIEEEVSKANLQTVDYCALGEEEDTLKVRFTLKFLGDVTEPHSCNESKKGKEEGFLDKYERFAKGYIDEHGFEELAFRYAYNLANGRFLWRNRFASEEVEVVVREGEEEWRFNAFSYPLADFDRDFDEGGKVAELAEKIGRALALEDGFLLLEVEARAKMGKGQEVYPSEELIPSKGGSKDEKSKILYSSDGKAAFHSQKIGNAVRTCDTWYPEYEEEEYPIPFEPYGTVSNMGRAFRPPTSKKDFYTLFAKALEGESVEEGDLHYVMGCLVRGGVYGGGSKE